jgi:hypothetical protein
MMEQVEMIRERFSDQPAIMAGAGGNKATMA